MRTPFPARPLHPPASLRSSFTRTSRESTVDAQVLAAFWCRSVGATWTVELRPIDRGARARPVEWICSGVPTQQPTPDRQTADLLRERGLLLFPVEPLDPDESPPPRISSRRLIGYVTRNPQLLNLALKLGKDLVRGRDHAMVVAARRMREG